MATLAEIRAKLLENQNKGNRENTPRSGTGGDNASFPFWNIPFGQTATLRFLPDSDQDNVFFWRKKEVIKLPFEGVVGGDYPTNERVKVNIPCIDMFDMACPITAHIRPWWKDDAKKELARTYYKKKSYIFQGFVVTSPLDEADKAPENPIRRFVINPSIFEIIEKSLHDPEIEDTPTDYTNGLDFRLSKTQKGDYANYQTSTWSRRSRSLDETERSAIDTHGLFKLNDYLGRIPDADEIAALTQMFHDSLNGLPFDSASYGHYYRAYKSRDENDDVSTSRPVVAAVQAAMSAPSPAAPVQQAPVQQAPVQTASIPASSVTPQDILERIKTRTAK